MVNQLQNLAPVRRLQLRMPHFQLPTFGKLWNLRNFVQLRTRALRPMVRELRKYSTLRESCHTGDDVYSAPKLRVVLLDPDGRVVDYQGSGFPGDTERIGRMWHRGRSPRSGNELHLKELVMHGTPFESVSDLGVHPDTDETVNLYMHGKPIFHPETDVLLGFEVISVLRPAVGEGAVVAGNFTHIREVGLWNTTRSHLAYLELKHPYTALHGVMVGVYARAFAEVLSPLLMSGLNVEIKQDEHGRGYRKIGFTDADLYELFIAGQLHDCGKALVDLDVLDSPGRLSEAQMQEMRGHLLYGELVIFALFATVFARRAAESHHPYSVDLSMGEWPFEGRLMAVADVFDAIASKRTYREGEGTGPVNALNLLLNDTTTPIASGSRVMKMDPVLVGVFRDHFPKINALAMGHLAEEIERRRLELAQVSGRLRQAENEHASHIRVVSLTELFQILADSKAALEAQLRLRSDWGTQVAEHFGLSK